MTQPNQPRVLPVLDIKAMEREYHKRVVDTSATVDLADWLPAFGKTPGRDRPVLRPIRGGEVVIILADVGAGKSCILQNIFAAMYPKVCMIFQLELPPDLCYERFAAMNNSMDCYTVEELYKNLNPRDPNSKRPGTDGLEHIYTIAEPRVTLGDIEATVMAAKESKIPNMTGKPIAVGIDYLGLITGDKRGSRYEFTSEVANSFKPLAKTLDVALIVTCQIHRKNQDASVEVGMHDARDSGQIEGCGDVLLGAWREPDDRRHMKLRICKGRKDGDGEIVDALFDGRSMSITPWPVSVYQPLPGEPL